MRPSPPNRSCSLREPRRTNSADGNMSRSLATITLVRATSAPMVTREGRRILRRFEIGDSRFEIGDSRFTSQQIGFVHQVEVYERSIQRFRFGQPAIEVNHLCEDLIIK